MRSRLAIGLAVVATALALVHCAGEPDDPAATSDEASVLADATASAMDGHASDANDAGISDASVDSLVPHCSPDHWCRTPLPSKDISLAAVWSFAPDDAIAVGTSGMFHWDGKVWSVVESDAGLANLSSIWASGPNDVWATAVGEHRLVHGTRAAGGTLAWTSNESDGGPTRDLVTGVGNDLFVSGTADDGTSALQHGVRADGGAPVFTPIPISVTPFSIEHVFASSKDELWVSGFGDPSPVVLHAQKTGANYVFTQSFAALSDYDFPAMWGFSNNDIWAVGEVGNDYHRTVIADGGVAWTPVANDAKTALSNIWGAAPNDVYAIGYLGGIRHWDGKSWTVSRIAVNGNPIFNNLFGLHGSSANDVWAVGEGVALHRTPGGGP